MKVNKFYITIFFLIVSCLFLVRDIVAQEPVPDKKIFLPIIYKELTNDATIPLPLEVQSTTENENIAEADKETPQALSNLSTSTVIFLPLIIAPKNNIYYVATNGNNSNKGTINSPWRTIAHAIEQVPDQDSIIVVRNGVYNECVTITRRFQSSLYLKAENQYQAHWQCNQSLPILKFGAARNITLEGFEFTRPDLTTDYRWFVIVWQNSHATVENITLRNNIFHDSC